MAAGERARTYEAAVLKTLGAPRGRILAEFALRSAILGGAAGLVLGLAAVLALGYQFAALDSGMIASASFGWIDVVVNALIPTFGVLLAVATARFTVLAAVRKML